MNRNAVPGFGALLVLVWLAGFGCLVVAPEEREARCDGYTYERCKTFCDPHNCWQKCRETKTNPETCPQGNGRSGGHCVDGSDCPRGTVCVEETCRPRGGADRGKGGLCQSCETAHDCHGDTTRCVHLGSRSDSGKMCSPTCRGSKECPSGFECVRSADAGIGQCLPEKNSDGERSCEDIPGAECTSARDCTDGERCVRNECVPPEDAECSSDDDCASGEACRDFRCVSDDRPDCVSRKDCRSDEICIDGTCKSRSPEGGCVFNRECDEGALCVDGKCLSRCKDRRDCNPREFCRQGLCQPIECRRNPDCPAGKICVEARCVDACRGKEDCPDGYVCSRHSFCKEDPNVECRTNAECTRKEMCRDGACVTPCNCNQQCPSGEICDMETGRCRKPDPPDTDPCSNDCDCPSGETCRDGVCKNA